MTEPKILQISQFRQELAPRPKDSHKGMNGHVLVVGGELGFSGAPRMAAEAALRVGAGLVSVATRKAHAFAINMVRPEIMSHGVENEKALASLIDKATVIVLGPGLGRSAWSKKLFTAVLKSKRPLIVDADGLNLLAEKPMKKNDWILTPHVGEAARLLKVTPIDIQRDRIDAIQKLQKKYGGVVVLKGSQTLVKDDKQLVVSEAGNPGMASAGMGDVLSGVIGGLLAQHFSIFNAAGCGVLVHALAGDKAAALYGERGIIATDLYPFLHQLVNFS